MEAEQSLRSSCDQLHAEDRISGVVYRATAYSGAKRAPEECVEGSIERW